MTIGASMRRNISHAAIISRAAVLGAAMLVAGAAAPVGAAPSGAAKACAAPVAPTGELAPWASPVALKAADGGAAAARAPLAIAQAARLALLPTARMHYPLRTDKAGKPGSYGGLVEIDVRQAGTYRVSLGAAAWVDVVRQGRAIASTAHAHGPDCSGIRKMVSFALTPGRYTVQIAAAAQPEIAVLVTRTP